MSITPPPTPPLPVPTPTISAEINIATRKQHLVLNKLIIERLPLALPPNQQTPGLYGHGLAAFAQIYFTFESVWSELATSPRNITYFSDEDDPQLRHWLLSLRPEGLERSSRLKNDLAHISTFKDVPKSAVELPKSDILQRMRGEIMATPQVLVAYAWVMYMAIFSGGRWIRQELAKTGDEFWLQHTRPIEDEKTSATMPGLSFLSFDGDQDGEDIKALFKARLAEAETFLTQQERQDIVNASQQLFDDCIALVGELDRFAWRPIMLDKGRSAIAYLAMFVALGLLCWVLVHH